MDPTDETRDAPTGPRARDFKEALREQDVNAALQEGRVNELRREELRRDESLRTYETAASTAPTAPTTPPPASTVPPTTGPTTPETYREVGTAGSSYETTRPAAAPVPTTEPGYVPPAGVTERRVETYDRADRPFSWAAGVLGWAVASFFTFLFLALILGILGNAAYNTAPTTDPATIARTALNNLTWAGIVGGLIAVFAAYFLGGYNAGRIDRYHGMLQGVAVVAWTVIFGILAALLANAAADTFNLGAWLAPYDIDWGDLTTQGILGLLLTLGVMLGGAVLGGLTGERWLHRDTAYESRGFRARSRPRV